MRLFRSISDGCATQAALLNSKRIAFASAVAAAASVAVGQTSPIVKGTQTVKLTLATTINIATDGTPQDFTFAPGDASQSFIATRNGNIRVMSGGSVLSTPFLSLASAGVSVYTGGEGGLLGLAFNPNYTASAGTVGSGKFYTVDTEPFSTTGPAADYSEPELFPTTGTNPNNQVVVREWSVNPSNPNAANSSSRVLLRINHPQSNHQGGSLRFGPDGDLYLGLGDGGGGNDFNGTATSTTDGHNNAIGNGQDTTVPLGKILRIDVNAATPNSPNGQYGIPSDNPFASGALGNLKEIYAYGLRNPYKFNFDSVTGKLYVADVGQSQREEVDTIVNGGNYGWPFREGTRDNSGANGSGRTTPVGFTSLPPIAEYTHGDGDATVGGYLYNGATSPSLDTSYIFGDYQGTASTGRIFYTAATGGTISEFNYDSTGVTPSGGLIAFGSDSTGEVYALFDNGKILNVTGTSTSGLIVVNAGQTYQFPANPGTGLFVRPVLGLTINASGQAILAPSSTHANRQILTLGTNGLTLAGSVDNWTGRLDLGNGDLDIPDASLTTVFNQLRQGFNNGSWNNSGGITSAAAAADTSHLTALGVIRNDQSGTPLFTSSHRFDTSTPGISDVLVKYTYLGDTNLDGIVDGSDYSRIDSGFISSATGWYNGDFNYDGVINGSDYTLIDNSFNTQFTSLAGQLTNPNVRIAAQVASNSEVSPAVPEPGTSGLLCLVGITSQLSCRRRCAVNANRVVRRKSATL